MTENSREISVVIPVKDRLESLLRAVASVKAQTIQITKIVVVDDGSVLPVADALKTAFPDVICLRNETAKGAPRARNMGWQHAGTPLIAFLDSDDELEPACLERKIALLVSGEFDMVLGSVTLDDGVTKKRVRYQVDQQLPLRDNLLGNQLFDARTSTFVIKRTVLAKFSFDEKLSKHQDWDLFIQIDSRFKVGFTNESDTIIHISKEDRISSKLKHDATRYFVEKNAHLVKPDSMFIFVVKMLFRAQRIADSEGEQIYKQMLGREIPGLSLRNRILKLLLTRNLVSARALHSLKRLLKR